MTTQLRAAPAEPPHAFSSAAAAPEVRGWLARVWAVLLRGSQVYADLARNQPMK